MLHRKTLLEFDHHALGKVKQAGICLKLSDTPGQVKNLALECAERTEVVLLSLGCGNG
ncbi:MAG: hypothetical protein ABIH46_07105 [Chloroflexota bacterium]